MCRCCFLQFMSIFFPHAWHESEGARLSSYYEEQAKKHAKDTDVDD